MTNLEIALQVAAKHYFETYGTAIGGDKSAAIERAFVSRGKDKGKRLLTIPPSVFKDPWGFAAWNGIQPNPFKIRTGGCLFLDDEPKAFLLMLAKVKWMYVLDKDLEALVGLGVW